MLKGILIAVEGIDGSGKTTISKGIVENLSSKGFRAAYTYEPFESPFSQALQRVKEEKKDNPYIDALAMASDRAYHLHNVVLPLLENGWIVVCDRYYYSSLAYQSAMGAPLKWVMDINSIFRKPDIAIYLDVSVGEALNRLKHKHKGGKWVFFEKREILEKVRDVYLRLVSEGYLIRIDAERPYQAVLDDVLSIIESRIPDISGQR